MESTIILPQRSPNSELEISVVDIPATLAELRELVNQKRSSKLPTNIIFALEMQNGEFKPIHDEDHYVQLIKMTEDDKSQKIMRFRIIKDSKKQDDPSRSFKKLIEGTITPEVGQNSASQQSNELENISLTVSIILSANKLVKKEEEKSTPIDEGNNPLDKGDKGNRNKPPPEIISKDNSTLSTGLSGTPNAGRDTETKTKWPTWVKLFVFFIVLPTAIAFGLYHYKNLLDHCVEKGITNCIVCITSGMKDCNSEGIRIENPFDHLLGNISLNKREFKFKEKIYLLEEPFDSWVEKCLKSVQNSQDRVFALFAKIQPFLIDIIERKSSMKNTLRKFKEKADTEELKLFLKSFGPKDAIIALIESVDEYYYSTLGEKIYSAGYPIPLGYLKKSSYAFNYKLLEETLYKNDVPLFAWVTTSKYERTSNILYGKEIFGLQSSMVRDYSEEKSYTYQFSIDLYRRLQLSNHWLSLAEIHGITKNLGHQSALKTILNFSAVVIVHIGPEDSISDKTSEINQLFALLKQQIVRNRGYLITIVDERTVIKNLTEFKATLRKDFGSRLLDLIEYKSFAIADEIETEQQRSKHRTAISGLVQHQLSDPKYIMHSVTYIRDFYLTQTRNLTQNSNDYLKTDDQKYTYYLNLLNEFDPLPKKASNFETEFEKIVRSNDIEPVFPRLFRFSNNLAEINKLEQERDHLKKKSARSSIEENSQIYEQYLKAGKKQELLKDQSQLIELNPVVNAFMEVFRSPYNFSNPANWAIKSWVEPYQNKVIQHMASLRDSSEAQKKKIQKLISETEDKDISLERFMNELLYSPIAKEDEDSIKNYLNLSIYQHNPLNLINEHLEFGNQLFPSIFGKIPIDYKIYVISIIGPQSSGKSTALNYLFGVGFKTSAGRCTKGIYFTLLLNPEMKIAILLLDTEGLMAIKRTGTKFDNQMATFIFSVSNLVIINYKGEIQDSTVKLIEVCAYALKVLSMEKIKPTVFWALQSMVAADSSQEKLQEIQQNMIRDLKDRIDNKDLVLDELFDLKPENVFPFPPPFYYKDVENLKILEYNGAYGSRILEFREKLIKSLNDTLSYNSGEFLYEHFQKNWRTVIEFADDLMQAKSLFGRKLIEEAFKIGVSIFQSLKRDFIAHFDQLLDSFDNSSFWRPQEFQDALDQEVYIKRTIGDAEITNKIEKHPNFEAILDEVPRIRQRLIQDLNILKYEYRAKHQIRHENFLKKQSDTELAIVFSEIFNNPRDNYTLKVEALNTSINENITRVIQHAKSQQDALKSKIYLLFVDAIGRNSKINWHIPTPVDLKGRFEKGPGNTSLEYIEDRWYQQNPLQKVASTLGGWNTSMYVQDQYLKFIGSYKSICNLEFTVEEVKTLINDITHHLSHVSSWGSNIDWFILTEEYKSTLLLEFQVLIHKCMEDQIISKRDSDIQYYRDIFRNQIQFFEKLYNESDSSKLSAEKIVKDFFMHAVDQLADDLLEKLKSQLESKLEQKFPKAEKMNEEAYARSFQKPKHSQEDFVPVVKYVLNLKKFIEEIYDDEVKQLFELQFKTLISKQLESDFQNLAERLKFVLISLQTGDVLSYDPYFYWIKQFQTNTSSLYNFTQSVVSESEPKDKGLYISFTEALRNQIRTSSKPRSFKESQQKMVGVLRSLLSSFDDKKIGLEPFFSKLEQHTKGFEGLENITSNYIYWLFKTDPFLGHYKPPIISVKIESIEFFLTKALEQVAQEMEGVIEKIGKVKSTLFSSVHKCLKAKQPALVGCLEQCPICGEKCSLPNDGHRDHHAHTHNLGGLRSYYNTRTRKILLHTCSSEEIRKLPWNYDGKALNFLEFVDKASQGAWTKKFPKADKSKLETEDQIISWVGTKDFFLHLYNIEDSQNPEWEKKVSPNIRLPKDFKIPGYTDQKDFLVMVDPSKNLKEEPVNPLHFVLILDSSGSMSGQPWNDLLASVRRFLSIREQKSGPQETVSIIVFSSTSDIVIRNASVSVNLANKINFIGYNTIYESALRDLELVISAEPKDSRTKFIPIFMSDGLPHDNPAAIITQIAGKYKEKLQGFWTVGFGSSDFSVLKKMAKEMGGEYKGALTGIELGEVFEEIGRKFYFSSGRL